jgi:hypothetical protein
MGSLWLLRCASLCDRDGVRVYAGVLAQAASGISADREQFHRYNPVRLPIEMCRAKTAAVRQQVKRREVNF